MNVLLDYFKSVLGVRSILLPRDSANFKIKSEPVLFLSEHCGEFGANVLFCTFRFPWEPSLFHPQSIEMLKKMQAAMKISDKEAHIMEWVLEDRNEGQNFLQNLCAESGSTKVVIFEHPEYRKFFLENDFDQIRGKVYKLNQMEYVFTYSPVYLLDNISYKKQTWTDLQLVIQLIENGV